MAFKQFNQYMEEKNGQFFLLPNNRDYADVIFLYRNVNDVLVADTHYVKSPDYSGYVHCCGHGCPACAKGIRVQTKIFIPLYNYKTNRIEFWDRSNRFERQLQADVLSKFPNPSEWVFRITRNGEAGSIDTTYEIVAQGKNSSFPYDAILASQNITLPDGYSQVVRDCTPGELSNMVNSVGSAAGSSYEAPSFNYVPTPRASSNNYTPPSTSIPEPVSVQPPAFGQGPDLPEAVPGIDEIPFTPDVPEPTFDSVPSDNTQEPVDDLGDVNF